MKKNILKLSVCFLVLLFVKSSIAQTKTEINYAKALNEPDVSDCFPFISSDGLRIYYSSERTGKMGIFYSERKSLTSFFDAPKLLDEQFGEGYESPSLTSDELTIYVSKRINSKVYRAYRKSKKLPFGELDLVEGNFTTNFYAPCISPNGKELVFNDTETDILSVFKINSTKNFDFSYDIEIKNYFEDDKDLKATVPRYSSNGLRLYLALKGASKNGVDDILIVFERLKITDKFINYKAVTAVNGGEIIDTHATATSNGKIIAATHCTADSWINNDIIILNVSTNYVKIKKK